MLGALIAYVEALLKADVAAEDLKRIGRTAAEMEEWLEAAWERPGVGVPMVLLRYLGVVQEDVEAMTAALRSGDDAGAEPGGGSMAEAGESNTSEGGESRRADLLRVSVHGQTVYVDSEMVGALVTYVHEVIRTHSPREVERRYGRTVEELREWAEGADQGAGFAMPRLLLRQLGPEIADIEAGTAILAGKPDHGSAVVADSAEPEAAADTEDGGDSEAAGEPEAIGEGVQEGLTGAGTVRGSVDVKGRGIAPETVLGVGDSGEMKPAAQGGVVAPLPRIVYVAPVDGEAEWFGEKAEFAMRQWRYLREKWLQRWNSGEKNTLDGLIEREQMLEIEIDLIEHHNMTLTTGLPWVVESLEWDELTRQEQASWRHGELADIQEERAAVERSVARRERLRRVASSPWSLVRRLVPGQ